MNNGILIENEFASITILYDESANGPRILVKSNRSDTSVSIDPIALEFLTRINPKKLQKLIEIIILETY